MVWFRLPPSVCNPLMRWQVNNKASSYLNNVSNVMKVCTVGIAQTPKNFKYDDERFLTKEDKKTISYLFKTRVGIGVDFMAWLHKKKNFSWNGIQRWHANFQEAAKLLDQRYIPERHRILGPDLATAHFIVHRKGSVRFKGYSNWVKMNEKGEYHLPNKRIPDLYLEAINASGTNLMYEGFDNLVHLLHLKYLSLSKCERIDDWCLDRLTMFRDTLEHLDISGCGNITERGVMSLHRLSNLKYLNLADLPRFENKELVCLLLEDVLPECRIVGVDYLNLDVLSEKDMNDLLEKMSS